MEYTEIISSVLSVLPQWLIVVLAFIGSLHLAIPPLQKAAEAVIGLTPSKKDDEVYAKVTTSKAWKVFCNVVDYLFSLKLKKEKK